MRSSQQFVFYTTITGTRPYPGWLPDNVDVLLSAGSLWSSSRSKFIRRSVGSHRLFFLDSGGFTCLNRFGYYPWTIEDYVRLIRHYQPDYAAVMDYPCEPDINRVHYSTNKERIDLTIENTKLLLDCDLGKTVLVPVLQGYEIEEYSYCWNKLKKLGSFGYVGVGSVCRRVKVSELQKLILSIASLVRSSQEDHTPKLHWFGLKISALTQPGVLQHVYSSDSSAWTMQSGPLKYVKPLEHEKRWGEYQRKVYSIMRTSRSQCCLSDFF